MLDEKSGLGVLCARCWDRLTQSERIRFYFEHWLKNAKWWERLIAFFDLDLPASWERLLEAVSHESEQEWIGYCQTCGESRKVKNTDARRCKVCERPLMERMRL